MTAASARICKIWSLSASTRSTGTGPSTKSYSRIHSSRRAHFVYLVTLGVVCTSDEFFSYMYSVCYVAQVRVVPQGRVRIVHHRGLASRSTDDRWRRPVALSVTASCVIALLHFLWSERRLVFGDSSVLLPWPLALKAPLLSALSSSMAHSHFASLLVSSHSAPLNLLFFWYWIRNVTLSCLRPYSTFTRILLLCMS